MRHKGPLLRGLDFAARTSEKFNRDHLSAFSAQATFYLMLAIFPFVMLLCLAIRLLPFMSKDTLLMAVGLIPESYRSFITEMINGYFNDNFGYVGIALIIFLIWTASRFMQALINGFNTAYGIEENRNQVVLRLIGCLYTVVLCGILVCLVVMYALGTKIVGLMINFAPALLPLEFLITLARNLAMPALLLLIFWMSYVFLPSRKGHFLDELPGALLTTIVWRGSAALYGFFVQMSMDRYSYVYGTLTGVVMILIWLYTDMFFWFVGAELNSFVLKYKSEHPPLRNAYRKSKLFRKKNQNPPPDQQNQSR
ncbi:MAG: YihY/virulence factor BrkB family protein [Oscillospiraceae bacterium]|nr:YihY/virulence factor BrkB family protein [Oscillospiraceae bacterium]